MIRRLSLPHPLTARGLRFVGEVYHPVLVDVAGEWKYRDGTAFQPYRWPDGQVHTVEGRHVMMVTPQLRAGVGITEEVPL